MNIRYIYRDHRGSKQLVGAVVKDDEGRLGYSLCHPNDRRKLTRKLAREIALARAEKRHIFYDNCDFPQRWVSNRNNEECQPPTTIIPYLEAMIKQDVAGA